MSVMVHSSNVVARRRSATWEAKPRKEKRASFKFVSEISTITMIKQVASWCVKVGSGPVCDERREI